MMMAPETLAHLRMLASDASERAFVPYSKSKDAAVLLLSDGAWIPGVRVESATFSLTIPPLLNAVTTAVAAARIDVVAAVASRSINPAERAFAAACPFLHELLPAASDALVKELDEDIPAPEVPLPPYLSIGQTDGSARGGSRQSLSTSDEIALVRKVAERAYVPESGFPVGCLIRTTSGEFVPGVNVEHPDWSHILCAERNALGTCKSYGLEDISALWVTCLHDSSGTPCGACRQLLVELAPTATLWMDRGKRPPARSDPATLLPGAFSGSKLTPNT